MEKFLKNQQIPLTQVIDPNTGQAYYAPQNVVYQDKNNTGVTSLKGVIVDSAITASYALTASYAMNGGGGGSTNTGSLLTTASFSSPNLTFTKGNGSTFNVNLSTLTVTSASYAATASLAPLYLPLAGGTISGDVTVLGTASINTLIVNQIGYSSGSNQLGDASNDTQTLYGTVVIPTGSLIVSGTLAVTSSAIIQTLTVGLGVGRVASNTALGYQALNANTTGASNVAIGYQSGLLMSTGANNSSLGYFSLRLNTTGSGNTALGNYAMSANVGGNNSTGVGSFALQNTTGNNNTGIGNQSLVTNTSGINNTALGQGSLYYNTTASNNTAVGYRALQTNTIGADNTSMGVDSLLLNSTGSSNVAIGKESLRSTTTSTNTAIGYQAGYNNTSGANNIFIGANSTGASVTDSNRTWIGNSSTTSTWLAGNVLIGTTTDAGYKLLVRGSGTTSATTALLVQNSNASASLQVYDDRTVYFPAGNISYGVPSGSPLKLNITQPTGTATYAGVNIGHLNTAITSNVTVVGGRNTMNDSGHFIFGHQNNISAASKAHIFGTSNTQNTNNGDHIIIGSSNTSDAFTNGQNASIIIGQGNSTNGFWGGGLIGSSLKYYANSQLAFGGNSGNVNFALSEIYFGNGVRNENFSGNSNNGHGPNISINTSQAYSGSSALDRNGGNITLRGGQGTGTGSAGDVIFTTAVTGSTGATYHSYTNRVWIKGHTGNVGIGISTPSASLHISGASSNVLLEIDSPTVNNILYVSGSGNVGIGTGIPTSRLTVSGAAGTNSAIYAYKSGSTVLDIQGSQGQLFSVIDALSGSLMSVNDVSGLPILEVFSDDRVVMGTYGAPALTVTGSTLRATGSLLGTASYATQALSASWAPSTGGSSFPYTGSAEITGSLGVTGSLIVNNGISNVLDTNAYILYDSSAASSLDWQNRNLYDSNGALSVDWQSRDFADSSGNSVLSYDVPVNGYKITSPTYYLSLLDSGVQENFTNVPQDTSGVVNFEGEVIEGVLDGSVVTNNLVYLDTDGTWYQLTQGTDQCSKLIGICVESRKGWVLLEGSLTVASTPVPDSPYVESLAAGRPIYIQDSSGTKMSTTSPTGSGQYSRVLGHAYYNSTTYTDYWTMKFRPSNDWFQNN